MTAATKNAPKAKKAIKLATIDTASRKTIDMKSGDTVRVHQKIRDITPKGDEKERIQMYEGTVINIRGAGIQRTMTVRKVSDGIGVEKIFPLALPTIDKIELIKQYKTNRKVLSFIRTSKKRLKEVALKLKTEVKA